MEDCCQSKNQDKLSLEKEQGKGFWSGLFYGLIPHSFCIAFIVFSIIGATTATVFLQKLLIFPYFFQILMAISVLFATFSAWFYLKNLHLLSFTGIKRKANYLLTLYGATILINLLFFFIIFPVLANFNSNRNPSVLAENTALSLVTLRVDIPCPGHAPLINGEIKKLPGVQSVYFQFPNLFEVQYDAKKISPEEILNLEIFKTYKAFLNDR